MGEVKKQSEYSARIETTFNDLAAFTAWITLAKEHKVDAYRINIEGE